MKVLSKNMYGIHITSTKDTKEDNKSHLRKISGERTNNKSGCYSGSRDIKSSKNDIKKDMISVDSLIEQKHSWLLKYGPLLR